MIVHFRKIINKKPGNTFEKIHLIVKNIPRGTVSTYGQIAALTRSGLPARIVGYALHSLPADAGIPWHRVVNSKGSISQSIGRNEHDFLQRLLLEEEGIAFNKEGKIDLKKYLWHP